MQILIAEDDISSQEILKGMLTPYGECITALDGSEAVELFKKAIQAKRPFDLICLDIMMPNMDGQTALKKIREIEKHATMNTDREAVIIMTTALEDIRNVDEAFYQGGASSYIVKPINRDLLLEDLRKFNLI